MPSSQSLPDDHHNQSHHAHHSPHSPDTLHNHHRHRRYHQSHSHSPSKTSNSPHRPLNARSQSYNTTDQRHRHTSDSPNRSTTPKTPRSGSIKLAPDSHSPPPHAVHVIPKPPARIMPFAPSPIASSVPPPAPNSHQMMGYPQYGQRNWGMGLMGMNPYMMQQGPPRMAGSIGGSQFQGQGQMGLASSASSTQYDANGNELKPFDSSQMKQGRLGHYGYLEGRELAGPPVGHLPAGMQPNGPVSPPRGQSTISPASGSPRQGSGSYNPSGSVAESGQYSQSGAGSVWGDARNMPRARYDGAPSYRQGQVQADTDTPYPRSKAGGMATNHTTYQDGAPVESDYRYSLGHRGRIREGRV